MKSLKDHKNISESEKDILARCSDAIRSIEPSAEVILYGSRARGDAEPESDYDLLILTEGEVTLEREDLFRQRLFPIELETGAVLTVMLTGKDSWNSPLYNVMPLYQNIRKDGLIL